MIRDITISNSIGTFNLKVMKTKYFDYEILLPKEYGLIYSGYEMFGIFYNEDIRDRMIEDDGFKDSIIVINRNPLSLGYSSEHERIDNPPIRAKELYTRIINGCSHMTLWFNKDKKIDNITIGYYYDIENKSCWPQNYFNVFNDEYPISDFYIQKQY